MTRLVATFLALSLVGCGSVSYTTYLIPRQGQSHPGPQRQSTSRQCAEKCKSRYYAEVDDAAYARCLKTCPGVRVFPNKKCSAESEAESLVCFTHKDTSGPSTAGKIALATIAVVFVVGGIYGLVVADFPESRYW